jgi:hypothetical protein
MGVNGCHWVDLHQDYGSVLAQGAASAASLRGTHSSYRWLYTVSSVSVLYPLIFPAVAVNTFHLFNASIFAQFVAVEGFSLSQVESALIYP